MRNHYDGLLEHSDLILSNSYPSTFNNEHSVVTYLQYYHNIPVIGKFFKQKIFKIFLRPLGAQLKVVFNEHDNILHASGHVFPKYQHVGFL